MDMVRLVNLLAKDKASVDPIYVLHGPEIFLIEHVLERLKQLVFPGNDDSQMNIETVSGSDSSLARISDLARTMPLLSKSMMIIVREAHKLKTASPEPLLEYADSPNSSTCLVFCADSVDSRKKLWKALSARGWVHKAGSMNEKDLRHFLRSRASFRNVELRPRAVDVLISLVGNDLKILDDAVERLSLYKGDRGAIDVKDVVQVVDDKRLRSVFELTDAIGRKDAPGALDVLHRVLGQQERPIGLNHLLARQMRQLLICSSNSRISDDKLASLLRVPSFIARKIREQARRFSAPEIERALLITANVDLQLKSSPLSDEMILDRAILELCLGA